MPAGQFDSKQKKKLAYIFTWGPITDRSKDPIERDANLIADSLKGLGFKIGDECEGQNTVIKNLKFVDFIGKMKEIASTIDQHSCVLVYFIARQRAVKHADPRRHEVELVDEMNNRIPLFNAWEELRGTASPKIFIIQANVVNAPLDSHSALLNSKPVPDDDFDSHGVLNSINTFQAYLPNREGAAVSVAKVLNEELRNPFDINTVFTRAIARIRELDPQLSPKFGSTLVKLLYLRNRPKVAPERQPARYNISDRRKCLVYAFLFEKFDEILKLKPLHSEDGKHLTDLCKKLGFSYQFCVEDGRMTVSEFKQKLNEILQDRDRMSSCDCIMIVISSHGLENGITYASDGTFSRDDVWTALAKCPQLKGKPKVLVFDSCRGHDWENPPRNVVDNVAKKKRYEDYAGRNTTTQDPVLGPDEPMTDVLLVMSSTEGTQSFQLSSWDDELECPDTEKKLYSIFSRHLCEAIEANRGRHSLLTLLNAAMLRISRQRIEIGPEYPKLSQTATFTSTLTKILKFP